MMKDHLHTTQPLQIPGIFIHLAICLLVFASTGLHPEILPGASAVDSLARLHYNLFVEQNQNGKYSEALSSLKTVALLRDSAIRLQRVRLLDELNAKYELDKKKQEVDLLEKENALKMLKIRQNQYSLAGLAGLFILIFIIIIQLIRQRKLRTSRQKLIVEQTLLRSQMNPHFIFNTLTNIQSFVVRNETEASIRYLDHFSGLISSILGNSGKKVIPLDSEIETIENYCRLQQLRHGDKLRYGIEVEPGIESGKVFLPPMMVQPLVENAIDHGIKPKPGGGRVEVRFKKLETGLVIEVEDNGVGRQHKKEEAEPGKSAHAGLATVILKERLDSMKTGRFEILDLLDADGNGCGTIARLFLPLIVIDS